MEDTSDTEEVRDDACRPDGEATVKTKIIEATNGGNWGKFLVGQMDDWEWSRFSRVDPEDRRRLLGICQWGNRSILVLDLQTGEGARFNPPGFAAADLNQKHQIWVCPLYEPFLTWLYEQDLTDIDKLPDLVNLPLAPGALYGYRRQGQQKGDDE